MSSLATLEGRIVASFATLSPKQRAIARLILDNRYFASFASAAEIGEKVDASAATVVRLCQELGYEGLPDLQQAIRVELPSYLTAVERLEQRLTAAPNQHELSQRVFAADIANLQRTGNALSNATFDGAAGAIAEARRVLIVASGVTAAAAHFLAYSLQVINCAARAISDGDIVLAVNLAHLTPDDVVVGIGLWRYVRSTVEALERAKAQGARTIAITDSLVSPLARQADFAFEVSAEGVAHSLSITAIVSLMNALVAGVSLHDPARSTASLRRVDAQFHARDLLLE
jgi:DNA-binding MurR/RpiR family transcriptional regulator